jgi:hypothetical protein
VCVCVCVCGGVCVCVWGVCVVCVCVSMPAYVTYSLGIYSVIQDTVCSEVEIVLCNASSKLFPENSRPYRRHLLVHVASPRTVRIVMAAASQPRQ